MKRLSAFMTVILSFALLTIVGALLAPFVPILEESFGAQGGEMVQLAAGHVPTEEDAIAWKNERRQMQRDLLDMTGSA